MYFCNKIISIETAEKTRRTDYYIRSWNDVTKIIKLSDFNSVLYL